MVEKQNKKNYLRTYIFFLVVTVWAVAALFSIFDEAYNLPGQITTLVGTIIGWFIYDRTKRNDKDKN